MYSIEDRSQVITIGGEEHKLILTTKATKDITKRYGGLEKLGDKLLKNGNDGGIVGRGYLADCIAGKSGNPHS